MPTWDWQAHRAALDAPDVGRDLAGHRDRGAALVMSARRGLEVSVGENLVVFANSADIVLRAGLSWRS